MKVTEVINVALLAAGVSAKAIPVEKRADFDLANATLQEIADYSATVAKARIPVNSTCTSENVIVRKSWHDLTSEERIAYTDAVLCLQSQPSKTPSTLAAGAKTRYDDWVVTHINQTLTIHFTANFLGWHRLFVWSYERALRDECGYTGRQPYWDWAATAASGLEASPIFDGTATSMSGNGEAWNYTASDQIIVNNGSDAAVYLNPGTGGGCVTSGPFVNMTVNLGPDGLSLLNGLSTGDMYPFEWNPRCLSRSLTDESNQRFANMSSVLTLVREPADVDTFQTLMSGDPALPELGVHAGGHFSLGGDPGRDLYVSPGDPAFYLHHAGIDRTWWLWQMQNPDDRTDPSIGVAGSFTMRNETAPFKNGTAEDVQQIGFVSDGESYKLGELLDTTSGIFCYIYE